MSRSVNLEVKLPHYTKPTDETNDQLIKKFLRECSKESLVQYLSEKSSYSRRYVKRSVVKRQKRLKAKRNAVKYNKEFNGNSIDDDKKQKKPKKFVSREHEKRQ